MPRNKWKTFAWENWDEEEKEIAEKFWAVRNPLDKKGYTFGPDEEMQIAKRYQELLLAAFDVLKIKPEDADANKMYEAEAKTEWQSELPHLYHASEKKLLVDSKKVLAALEIIGHYFEEIKKVPRPVTILSETGIRLPQPGHQTEQNFRAKWNKIFKQPENASFKDKMELKFVNADKINDGFSILEKGTQKEKVIFTPLPTGGLKASMHGVDENDITFIKATIIAFEINKTNKSQPLRINVGKDKEKLGNKLRIALREAGYNVKEPPAPRVDVNQEKKSVVNSSSPGPKLKSTANSISPAPNLSPISGSNPRPHSTITPPSAVSSVSSVFRAPAPLINRDKITNDLETIIRAIGEKTSVKMDAVGGEVLVFAYFTKFAVSDEALVKDLVDHINKGTKTSFKEPSVTCFSMTDSFSEEECNAFKALPADVQKAILGKFDQGGNTLEKALSTPSSTPKKRI